jgi:hypothetical protein
MTQQRKYLLIDMIRRAYEKIFIFGKVLHFSAIGKGLKEKVAAEGDTSQRPEAPMRSV